MREIEKNSEGSSEHIDSEIYNVEDRSFVELCAEDPLYLWKLLHEYGMSKEFVRFICFFTNVNRFNEIISVLSKLDDRICESDLEAMVYCLGSNDV